MKRQTSIRSSKKEEGFALITVLLLLLLITGLAIGLTYMVQTQKAVSGSDVQTNLTYYGADSAMEKMMTDLAALYQTKQSPTIADVNALVAGQPSIDGITYPGTGYKFGAEDDGTGHPKNYESTISSGPNTGLLAELITYNLQVTAQGPTGTQTRMFRSVEVALIPAFQFGVFCDNDCSFFNGPDFDFTGRVHANGSLYLATMNNLTFHDRITSAGEVIREFMANGYNVMSGSAGTYTGNVFIPMAPDGCDGTKPACRNLHQSDEASTTGAVTDPPNPQWPNISTNTYQSMVLSRSTGAVPLTMPFVGPGVLPIEIVRREKAGDSDVLMNSRLAHKASIRILLDDDPTKLGPNDGETVELRQSDSATVPGERDPACSNPANCAPLIGSGHTVATGVGYRFATATSGYVMPAGHRANRPDGSASLGVPSLFEKRMQEFAASYGARTGGSSAPFGTHGISAFYGAGNGGPSELISGKRSEARAEAAAQPVEMAALVQWWPPRPRATPTPTPTPTPRPTATPTPTPTPTPRPRPTVTPNPTPDPTPYPTASPTPGGTPTPDGSPTATPSPGATPPADCTETSTTGRDYHWCHLGDTSPFQKYPYRDPYILTSSHAATIVPMPSPSPTDDMQWPLLTGYIRIEYRDANNAWIPVTREWLRYGFSRATYGFPNNEAGSQYNTGITTTNGYTTYNGTNQPDAIIYLQQVADRNMDCYTTAVPGNRKCLPDTTEDTKTDYLKTDGGVIDTVNSSGYAYYPINFYDTREGEVRDTSRSSSTGSLGGLMNVVELDVGNLKKWLTTTTNGRLVDTNTCNGFVVFFSDRRGNDKDHADGGYDYLDVINRTVQDGTPDNIIDQYEDVYGSGNYGQLTINDLKTPPKYLGTGFGLPDNQNPITYKTLPLLSMGRANVVMGPRHALRLVNGTLGNLPQPGFTVASEQPVYIVGNYNATNTGNLEGVQSNGSAASVIADTVSLLSQHFSDLDILESPANMPSGSRVPVQTFYRVAIATGRNKTFPQPGTWASRDYGTDGGVHNFLRFLENWSGVNVYYNGSMVSLFSSYYGVGAFKCCNTVYGAPNRHYLFDTNFLDMDKLPPCTPTFKDVIGLGFQQVMSPR